MKVKCANDDKCIPRQLKKVRLCLITVKISSLCMEVKRMEANTPMQT